MPTAIGLHAQRVRDVAALRSAKGRKRTGRFAFEGATLLAEAVRSGVHVEELYVTHDAYERTPLVRELEAQGTATFAVDARAAAKISDVEEPTGIVAIASQRWHEPSDLFDAHGVVLVLADVSDPGNAGTLVRCAEAFGCLGVVVGTLGADAYHPKVVRAAAGSLFRVRLARAEPVDLAPAAAGAGFAVWGLGLSGDPLDGSPWPTRAAVVIGQERRGLGPWEAVCSRLVRLPMAGPAESLNAASAGAIALWEATGRPRWSGS